MLGLVGTNPSGCIVVDSTGRVLEMNALASRLVTKGDGLTVEGGTVRAGKSSNRLRYLVAEAAKCRPAPCVMNITRPSGRPILLRLIGYCPSSSADPTVAIIISDLGDPLAVDQRVLRKLFGFTQTEASVACCLMCGLSLENTARELAITIHTVRTHLKRLFEKTGATRQAELVNILLRTPAHPDPQPGKIFVAH